MSGTDMSSGGNIAAWRARYPRAFGPTPLDRALRYGGFAIFIAWIAGSFWWLGVTPERIWNGLSGLGVIVRMMVPPSPGEQWIEILQGMAESVAMAFLGTFCAALVAVPLGFLGAGNVVTATLLRFSVRRLFDGMRGVDQLI